MAGCTGVVSVREPRVHYVVRASAGALLLLEIAWGRSGRGGVAAGKVMDRGQWSVAIKKKLPVASE
jgi:hypothetical protein